MRAHKRHILPRLIKAALRSTCRYRVAAVAFDHKDRIIGITVNTPRLSSRGWHAEELTIFSMPRSLRRIEIVRVGVRGDLLAIDPCAHCQKIASRRGIEIVRFQQ